jgi:formylglycine-generating enzyme
MRHFCLIASLLLFGCSRSEFVIVNVHAIPGGISSLIARSALDEQPAQSAESFGAPSGGFGGDSSFALELPADRRGRLSIAVEAWAGNCAVASQSGDAVLVGGQLMLDLTLAAITPQDCSGRFQHPADMVRVPSATFTMGCNAAVDSHCESDEVPAHTVTLSSYFIDRTEVSAAAYEACRVRGACTAALSAQALSTEAQAFVTWDDAVAFCAARGKRLPTEAEWELSARGTDGRIYPWGNDPPTCDQANYLPASGQQCYQDQVGVFLAPIDHGSGVSPFGVMNLAGNVEEWVSDWYVNQYTAGAATDPTGPATGLQRVLRGGSFLSSVYEVRATRRNANAPDGSAMSTTPDVNTIRFGIRCARAQ